MTFINNNNDDNNNIERRLQTSRKPRALRTVLYLKPQMSHLSVPAAPSHSSMHERCTKLSEPRQWHGDNSASRTPVWWQIRQSGPLDTLQLTTDRHPRPTKATASFGERVVNVWNSLTENVDFRCLTSFLDTPFDKSHITRGNCFKLSNQRFCHDVRKYSFIPRIINILNSLPDFVVNVDSINIFKSRLDKYWINQDSFWLHIWSCRNWRPIWLYK